MAKTGKVVGRIFESPWGYVGLAATGQGLVRVVLPASKARVERELRRWSPTARPRTDLVDLLEEASRQILEYLAGDRREFDLPTATPGAGEFARRVWGACSEIAYGQTRSYGWIAERIGRPAAARAVGRALGANPLPLLIPCHRVVRSDGALGGFGGGLRLKKKLLSLERRQT